MPQQRPLFNRRHLKCIANLQGLDGALLPPDLAKIARGLGIGRRTGLRWSVNAKDIGRLTKLAQMHTGWDLITALDGTSRHDAPLDDEKAGGRRAYDGVLLVRAWRSTHPGSHAVHIDDLPRDFDSLLMVENASLMFHFTRLKLDWPDDWGNPLAVYRGDRQFSPAAVTRLIESTTCPIDALPDLDLEGLRIAARWPRLRHVITPAEADLPTRSRVNHQRHLTQLAKGGGTCPRPDHAQIARWWAYLMRCESAIPQESWLSLGKTAEIPPAHDKQ